MTTFTETLTVAADDGCVSYGSLSTGAPVFGTNYGDASARAFFRFAGVTIPAKASITSATLTVTPTYADTGTLSTAVHGVAADNQAAFTTAGQVTGAPLTSAFRAVTATPAAWNTGTAVTVDVTAAVQEVLSRSGWASGNALALIGIDSGSGGNGYFEMVAAPATGAATLTVTYTTTGTTRPSRIDPATMSGPYYTPIPASPVLDAASAAKSALVAGGTHYAGLSWVTACFAVSGDPQYTIVYDQDPAAQPGQPYSWADGDPSLRTSGVEPVRIPDAPNFYPMPGDYSSGAGWDGWGAVIDTARGLGWAGWRMVKVGGQWQATTAQAFHVPGDFASLAAGSGRGDGLPSIAGSITVQEAAAALADTTDTYVIPHALAGSLPASMVDTGVRAPALKTDGTASPSSSTVSEGSRFFLPSSATTGSSNKLIRAIVRTLKAYGLFIVDRNGSTGLMVNFERFDPANPADMVAPNSGAASTLSDPNAIAGVYFRGGFTFDYFDLSPVPWSSLQLLSVNQTATPGGSGAGGWATTGVAVGAAPTTDTGGDASGVVAWTGAASGALALTVTVTPDPGHSPPRVRIDVADSRITAVGSLTVTRRNPDGHSYPVRTADGGPLQLSGGTATIYDHEAPYDAPIVYTTDQPGGPTVTTELNVDDVWLVHPGIPSRSCRVHVVALSARARATTRGLHQVLGDGEPIPISSGARRSAAATVGLRTYTDADRQALDLVTDDDVALLLNIPPSKPWGWDACYVSIGDLTEDRTVAYGRFPWREWALPVQVVKRPGGGTQASITWNDVAAQYPTWQAIVDAGVTSWAELAAPTSF